MPLMLTVLLVPTFLVSKVAALAVKVKLSPETRSSVKLTLAVVLPSYTLLFALLLMFKVRAVTSALVLLLVDAKV